MAFSIYPTKRLYTDTYLDIQNISYCSINRYCKSLVWAATDINFPLSVDLNLQNHIDYMLKTFTKERITTGACTKGSPPLPAAGSRY